MIRESLLPEPPIRVTFEPLCEERESWLPDPPNNVTFTSLWLERVALSPEPPNNERQKEESQPAAFYKSAALPTVGDVVVFGSGRGSEMLHGTIDNTRIFQLMRDQL